MNFWSILWAYGGINMQKNYSHFNIFKEKKKNVLHLNDFWNVMSCVYRNENELMLLFCENV